MTERKNGDKRVIWGFQVGMQILGSLIQLPEPKGKDLSKASTLSGKIAEAPQSR